MDVSVDIMSTKEICFMCNGNGFRTVYEDATKTNVVLVQCVNCNSKGEAFILDQKKYLGDVPIIQAGLDLINNKYLLNGSNIIGEPSNILINKDIFNFICCKPSMQY